MRFYYISIFSVLLLGLIYLVGTGLLIWFGLWLRKKWKRAWMVMVPLFFLLYAGPVAEEFWIAWNFDRSCKKDAGIFIYKTAEVDGFYNSTGASFELVRSGGYRWVEGPTRGGAGAQRLTPGDTEFMREAMARLEKESEAERAIKKDVLRVQMDANTEAIIFPKTNESWRVSKLRNPTARYHYTVLASHRPTVHGVKKFEDVVVDTHTNDVLGRYVNYYREDPWFFIGLDRPSIPCAETELDTQKYGSLIFYAVLNPLP